MADKDLVFHEVSRYAASLTALPSVGDALNDLVRRTASALSVGSTGVSLVREGRLRLASALDRMAADLGGVQEQEQSGPGSDALRTAQPVAVADMGLAAERWPGCGQRMLEFGAVATASIPLRSNGTVLGTCDLYETTVRPWAADDLTAARILCDMAAAYLAHAIVLDQRNRVVGQLQHALDSRVVIEQAKGMIAVQRGLSVGESFALLRRYARDHGAKLQDTAAAVVNGGLRL